MEEKIVELDEKIFELIENKKFLELKQILSEMQPADIAEILEEADLKDIPVIFRILPKELPLKFSSNLTAICSNCLLMRLVIKSFAKLWTSFLWTIRLTLSRKCPQLLQSVF